MRREVWALFVFLFVLVIAAAEAENGHDVAATPLRGLHAPARVARDTNDIAHIKAHNDHDLFFLQGYVHAQDRLFQMDVSRREASGTLAELVGAGALSQDVQMRTLGLRRAAERSLPVQSPLAKAILQAYAEGVNAYVASNALPPEYVALGLSHFDPWTPTDSLSVTKLLLFGQSFQLDIDPTVALLKYRAAGKTLGFDGTKLFFEDLVRSAPFDPASTVPDASSAARLPHPPQEATAVSPNFLQPRTVELAHEYMEKTEGLAIFARQRRGRAEGLSNEWAISSSLSRSDAPLLANDPHLDLGTPAIWYPIHLRKRELDAIGESFAGIPAIVVGHNRFVSWGLTDDPLDVTDTFQERIVPDAGSPSGLSTVFQGHNEPVIPLPEVFRVNSGGTVVTVPPGAGVPVATLIVPRRNNGPIISLDLQAGTGISVQWTGFSGTRELEAAIAWIEARTLSEFTRGNSFFSSAPLNLAYADIEGNIAYFAIGEVPVREDLQAGTVNGLPPFFMRDGTGGNEWLAVAHPQPHQAIPFEILPADEMPHIINPPAGFFVNSNNDPAGVTLNNNPLGTARPGGGIYYLAYTFDSGFRAGRETQLIREKLARGGLSFDDMQRIQADVTLLDAEFFTPFIIRAFANAQSSTNSQLAGLARVSAVQDAVSRLAAWNFTTPTGIPEGYDAGDPPGTLHPRSPDEIGKSVAATLYSVWRGQFVADTIDAALVPFGLPTPPDEQALSALRHLLENFATNNGTGASGVDFFKVPGVPDAADRRDIVILQSLTRALSLLSGAAFTQAFGGSTHLNDYRWGKLHRITFAHILGEPFSIPTAGGAFPQPLASLPGIPTDGGFQTVDAASHSVRAANENSFMFSHGPSKRSVFEGRPDGMRGVSSLPGGISGVLGSAWYANLLPAWLRNEAYDQLLFDDEIEGHLLGDLKFVPAN
jgi:penicillin G amidase